MGLNNNDRDIELIKQTKTLTNNNQTTKEKGRSMDKSFQQNSKSQDDSTTNRSSESSEVLHITASVSLKDLLSYQDVMNAIEREFHLHAGQEREIIMKLWLKGQSMISVLQRFRHLLQDLNIDDKDYVHALKQIREMIHYAEHDVQYFRGQAVMLEDQNRFLEDEFKRQLDRLVQEKNEQIIRLTRIIDQSCSPSTEQTQHSATGNPSLTVVGGTEELLKKFMQQNVELQHEIETLRAKLEYTFTFINEKFTEQTNADTSVSVLQGAFEQIRRMEMNLQELKYRSASQQEENDFLKYLIEKSQRTSTLEQNDLFRTIEKRSLEREVDRVRHELEITEKRTVQLEQRFEHSDDNVKFQMEKLKLKCDVLKKHILACSERLDQVNKQHEHQTHKNKKQQEESANEKKILQLENELLKARERYNELAEHSNTLKLELNNIRKQIHEKEKFESSSNSELERERRHANQLETELKSLRKKYEDVCERVSAATHQLERVKVVLEETSRRCEQLEKEKSEINAQSEHLSQNLAHVATKYKDKLHYNKSRLEQADREKREAQIRSEQLQNEIERLKDELMYKKETIYEKDRIIQDTQHQHREILLERQTIEERISNECKRFNDLMDRNRFLEEELDRLRRVQITNRRTEMDFSTNESAKHLEELRFKIDEFEKRFIDEAMNKESLQMQIKILEEENIDLRDIMNQMRKRAQDGIRDDRDRNDEIQKLIARAEFNARQYMTNFNLTTLTSPSALVRIVPLSSPPKLS